MSEIKAHNLTSLVSKKTRRAKARLLQNFGKADKTTDELFEVYLLNFNQQYSAALNLQKHVKQYLNCLKEINEASRGLSQCLLDMHERDWPKHDLYDNNAHEMDHVNEDLEEKLKETVLVPLEQYLGQFAELREKIAKRGRKLVDYDSQRHTYEVLQQSSAGKQHDDSKLHKHQLQMEEARRVYETLNNELHDELPALYDNRLPFIITVFQRLFSSKISYHNDSLTIHKSYLETVEQLAKATEKGNYNSVRPSVHHNQPLTSTTTTTNKTPAASAAALSHDPLKSQASNGTNDKSKGDEFAGKSSANVFTANKPPVLLHKVRATYKYLAEDEDELSFEAGEIIQVIEYDDPSEQEEGWLMGIKESDGQRGLFPANFTKEI